MILFRAPRRAVAAHAFLAAAVVVAPLLLLHSGVAADWTRAGNLPGLGSGRIWSLAIHPEKPAVVLAGTDNGVYASADGGATWQLTSVRGARVWTVGFDARAGHAELAGLANGGVRRSDDGGISWSDASAGLANHNVRSLAFGLGGIAAGTSDGVFVSDDGKAWRSAGLSGYNISALTVSANAPQFTLVAGSDGGTVSSGFLFRNPGPGPQWETLQQGLPGTAVVSSIAAGPIPASTKIRPLVVVSNKGTFFSGDGGTTWTSSTGPGADPNNAQPLMLTAAAFSPLDPDLVYAGNDVSGSTGGGLLRSTDSGKTFADDAKGLTDQQRNVAAITVAANQPPTVIAGINPPAAPSLVVTMSDTSAPPPAAVAPEGSPAPPATPTPTPSASASPTANPSPGPAPDEHSRLRRAFDWPIPLAIEILVVIGAAYGVVRWRQRRFDVEGPP